MARFSAAVARKVRRSREPEISSEQASASPPELVAPDAVGEAVAAVVAVPGAPEEPRQAARVGVAVGAVVGAAVPGAAGEPPQAARAGAAAVAVAAVAARAAAGVLPLEAPDVREVRRRVPSAGASWVLRRPPAP
jgi:hypothetical protein